jgi:excisionase family DNA binding protein
MENLFPVPEAAKRLGGISKWTVYSWVSKGKIQCVKIGSRTMIPESELLRLIELGRQSAENR